MDFDNKCKNSGKNRNEIITCTEDLMKLNRDDKIRGL